MLGILDDFYYLEGIGCFGVILVFLFILNDYIVVIVKYTQLLPNTLKVNIGLKFPKSFLNNLFMYPDFGGNSRNLSTPPLSAAQPTCRVLGQGYGASDQVAWTCPHSLLVVMFFYVWLVVSTPLKILVSWNYSKYIQIYGKKKVPNHQPDVDA